MFPTQHFDGVDALVDGSRQPITPRLVGITDDLLRHDSLNRCHTTTLPSKSARGQGATHVSRLERYTFVHILLVEIALLVGVPARLKQINHEPP